jgi:hypothetical protein
VRRIATVVFAAPSQSGWKVRARGIEELEAGDVRRTVRVVVHR